MDTSGLRAAINAKRASLRGSSFAADPKGFKDLESLKVRLNTSRDPLFYAHKYEAQANRHRARQARK